MKRTQIYLDQEQDRRLAARAAAAGTTRSTLIREAIETYLASSSDDVSRLAAFREAVAAVERTPETLPDGRSYVEAMRAADQERDEATEQRRR